MVHTELIAPRCRILLSSNESSEKTSTNTSISVGQIPRHEVPNRPHCDPHDGLDAAVSRFIRRDASEHGRRTSLNSLKFPADTQIGYILRRPMLAKVNVSSGP